jgi:hypothetical protein
MRTVHHAIATAACSERVFVTDSSAGWLLPTLVADAEIAQARLFSALAAMMPVPARARCLGFTRCDNDGLVAHVAVVLDIDEAHADVRLVPLDTLLARKPVLDYQASALRWLRTARHDSRSPFVRGRWIDEVIAWLVDVTGHAPTALRESVEILRAEPTRAVVRAHVEDDWLHFKADVRRPFVEAEVTQEIAARAESLVAPTRAWDRTRGWWLTRHVDGAPLDAGRWPAHLHAVDAWRELQFQLQPLERAICALGTAQLTMERIGESVLSAVAAVRETTSRSELGFRHPTSELAAAECVLARVETVLSNPLACELPRLALHVDAAPRNILWTRGGPAFLDLDVLRIGPAIVEGELMLRRMQMVLSPEHRAHLARYAAESLLAALHRPDLASQLHVTPALADLCLLASRQYELCESLARGEDEATCRAAWRRLSLDFVARLAAWPAL